MLQKWQKYGDSKKKKKSSDYQGLVVGLTLISQITENF